MRKNILIAKYISLAAVAFFACTEVPEECGKQFIDSDAQFCVNNQAFERCWGEVFNPLTEFCHENVVYSKCNGQAYTPPDNPCVAERSSSSLNIIIDYSSNSEVSSSSSPEASSSSSLNAGNSSSLNTGGSSSSNISSSSSVQSSSSAGLVYTVIFDGNGATSGTAPVAVKVNPGSAIQLPGRNTLERTGYTFKGWNADPPYTITSDTTIYAKWIPIYTVAFDGNEATGGAKPTAMKADSGSAIQLPDRNTLQKTGYVFIGWTADLYGTGDKYEVGSSYPVEGDITLYAVWLLACTANENTETHYCSEGLMKEYGFLIDDQRYPIQTYKTVVIGTQTWTAENLNYNAEGSRCYGDDTGGDSEGNCVKYGRLYNWITAMNNSESSSKVPSGVQGVCPEGWHLPSQAEWNVMTTYIGGENTAGKKLKATSGWNGNGNGTDEYGFSALPGAGDNVGYWWSTGSGGVNLGIYSNQDKVLWDHITSWFFSVRCLKNSP